MAIVKLDKVKVTFVNGRGSGFKVEEESESRGKTYRNRYSVWPTSESGVKVGDIISLSGFLSVKQGEPWEKDGVVRQSIEVSINSPRIDSSPAVPQVADDEPWATPSFDAEAPF